MKPKYRLPIAIYTLKFIDEEEVSNKHDWHNYLFVIWQAPEDELLYTYDFVFSCRPRV